MNKRVLWSVLAGVLIALGIGAFFVFGSHLSEKDISTQVAAMMQKKIDDSDMKEFNISVGKVSVIHDDGNKYQGIATVTMDEKTHDIAVKILVDGNNIMYETDTSQFAFVAQAAMKKAMADLTKTMTNNGADQLSPQMKTDDFVVIEPFTVNLKSEGEEKFLQTAITLRVSDAVQEKLIKTFMPQVRSRLLLLLSSKSASDISTAEGKKKLSEEIIAAVNLPFTPNGPRQGVSDIFFTSFVIQ